MKKKLLMITPENKEIHHFRKRQFNNFVQITMPYLAAFVDTKKYEITLVDEYNQKIPFDEKFDLVAITVNTSISDGQGAFAGRHSYSKAGFDS